MTEELSCYSEWLKENLKKAKADSQRADFAVRKLADNRVDKLAVGQELLNEYQATVDAKCSDSQIDG